MISVLGKMFLWQREGPGGRWTCQTSRRGETRDRRCVGVGMRKGEREHASITMVEVLPVVLDQSRTEPVRGEVMEEQKPRAWQRMMLVC